MAVVVRPCADRTQDGSYVEFVVESSSHVGITFNLKVRNYTNLAADKFDVSVDVAPLSEAVALKAKMLDVSFTYELAYEVIPKKDIERRTRHRLNPVLTLIADFDAEEAVLAIEVENTDMHDYKVSLVFPEKGNLQFPDEKEAWEVGIQAKSTQLVVKAGVAGSRPEYNYKVLFAPVLTNQLQPRFFDQPRTQVEGISEFFSRPDFIVHKVHDGKFVDPFFPPSNCSVYGLSLQKFDFEVRWMRPEAFLEGEISVLPKKFGLIHLIKGAYNTRWLLTAAYAIFGDEIRAKSIFLTDTVQESGMYKLRLQKDGVWQTVTVDDLIPCNPAGQPITDRSEGSELWPLLLLKALAKLYGSYLALNNGDLHDGIRDIYGVTTISMQLGQDNLEGCQNAYSMFQMALTEPACMIVKTAENIDFSLGLFHGCFYNIVKAVEYQGTFLINLANPWIKHGWNGDWSSNSSLWTPEAKLALWGESDDQGFTFWMKFEDLCTNFEVLIVYGGTKPKEKSFMGQVVKQGDMVVPRSYYKLVLSKATTAIALLSQENPKSEGCSYIRPIGMSEVSMRDSAFQEITSSVSAEKDNPLLFNLEAGKYFIIPKIDALLFVPTVHVPSDFPLMSQGVMHPLFLSTVLDIFKKYSTPNTEVLSFADFDVIARRTGLVLDEQQYETEIKARFSSTSEGLTREGLVEMFAAEVTEKGEAAVRAMVQSLGYDASFFSIESRVFKMSLETEEPCEFEELPYQELEQLSIA